MGLFDWLFGKSQKQKELEKKQKAEESRRQLEQEAERQQRLQAAKREEEKLREGSQSTAEVTRNKGFRRTGQTAAGSQTPTRESRAGASGRYFKAAKA